LTAASGASAILDPAAARAVPVILAILAYPNIPPVVDAVAAAIVPIIKSALVGIRFFSFGPHVKKIDAMLGVPVFHAIFSLVNYLSVAPIFTPPAFPVRHGIIFAIRSTNVRVCVRGARTAIGPTSRIENAIVANAFGALIAKTLPIDISNPLRISFNAFVAAFLAVVYARGCIVRKELHALSNTRLHLRDIRELA